MKPPLRGAPSPIQLKKAFCVGEHKNKYLAIVSHRFSAARVVPTMRYKPAQQVRSNSHPWRFAGSAQIHPCNRSIRRLPSLAWDEMLKEEIAETGSFYGSLIR